MYKSLICFVILVYFTLFLLIGVIEEKLAILHVNLRMQERDSNFSNSLSLLHSLDEISKIADIDVEDISFESLDDKTSMFVKLLDLIFAILKTICASENQMEYNKLSDISKVYLRVVSLMSTVF